MSSQKENALLVLSLTDLTSLNKNDTPEVIDSLCAKARELGDTAAVCVYPEFINHAKQNLENSTVKIATVVNFPESTLPYQTVIEETKYSLEQSAQEVDLVFPYQQFLKDVAYNGVWNEDNNYLVNELQLTAPIEAFVKQIADLCHKANAQLKVIIESGALVHPYFIKVATQVSIRAGADFVKTSTGKIGVHATLNAARTILETIKETNPTCGFKASGGIRTVAEAMEYINLAREIMGDEYVKAATFRFGASGIFNDIKALVNGQKSEASTSSY